VVLISGVSKEAARMTEKGLSLGAVDFILKYSPDAAVPPEALRKEIIAKVKAAARIKVIRSIPSMDARFRKKTPDGADHRLPEPVPEAAPPVPPGRAPNLVVVGASTGGPLALKELLTQLGGNFPFSMIIVQHMTEKFTAILAEQFNNLFPFPVREAADGDRLTPGTVLVAPGDRHLLVLPDGTVQISTTREINGHRPSIDVAMQSAAQAFGERTAGVILSGMGNDGAQGMLAIRHNCGATYAQSGETCVIDSMPKSAMDKDVIDRVGTPAQIGRWLAHNPGNSGNIPALPVGGGKNGPGTRLSHSHKSQGKP